MVFFVCEGCNETLKKNQVDKHAQRCRNCYAVTCVDCQVTFPGDEYASHIQCISEAEKYEKSLFKGKKGKLNPQDAWLAVVEEGTRRVQSAPPSIRQFLLRMGELSNIPRNKNKFSNFIKNSLKLHAQNLIDEIWLYLESIKKEQEMKASADTEEAVDSDKIASSKEKHHNRDAASKNTSADDAVSRLQSGEDQVHGVEGGGDPGRKRKKGEMGGEETEVLVSAEEDGSGVKKKGKKKRRKENKAVAGEVSEIVETIVVGAAVGERASESAADTEDSSQTQPTKKKKKVKSGKNKLTDGDSAPAAE